MSDAQTIARPYIKAVYEQAGQTGTVERWTQFLDTAGRIGGDSAVLKRISAPNFLVSLCQWIDQYLQENGHDKMNEQERNFMQLLDDHGRLGVLPVIAEGFRRLRNQEDGICQVSVFTAHALKKAQISELKAMLEKRTGRKVALTVTENPELIAGVRIEYDGLVIDQSMQGRIEQFAHKLDELRK